MRKWAATLPAIILLFILCNNCEAQGIVGKLKQKVKGKVDDRIDAKADKTIDDALDKTENSTKANTQGNQDVQKQHQAGLTGDTGSLKAYSKYDFVPGDKIIFQDNLKEEKEGEFPSQFNSSGGQGQVFTYNGENVFQTIAEHTTLSPRIKGLSYLPDQYTIEFDAYVGGGEEVIVKFQGIDQELTLYGTSAEFGNFSGEVPKEVADQWYADVHDYGWRHYAIAVNKTLLKAYIDQFRVLNVPSVEGKATSVWFEFRCSSSGQGDCQNMFLKNFRIAAGGIDLYKKATTDGKIVTHGITFDVDKSTIRPESMGTINQIFDLLKNNPSLKFEIDGHTDNSGSAPHNLTLSQDRAESVKTQLVKMGIDGSRLTTKGFGDTKPMSDNNSPEGKANNRRVEFVKIQ